jgi:uncharacterized protein (TIGR03790 family)
MKKAQQATVAGCKLKVAGLRYFLVLACFVALAARAANPGDEVIVVYNSAMPGSKSLAEYYAQRRHVPANQVFGFELTTNEGVSRAEFRDSLQRPLAKELESKNLWRVGSKLVPSTTSQPGRVEWKVVSTKIRYAVLCYGIPLRIESDPNLKEEATENLRPEMKRNEAAVDSELALLPLYADKPPLNGPLRCPVYGATNRAAMNPTNGVLLVTRLDGPSVEIARGLVDKAIQAETNGLWGRAYFDLRNVTDPGYKLGDDWIRNASEISRRLGFETIVDTNPDTFPIGFPMSHIAIYMGWYAGDACGPFALPKVEFMPGAFAYHLFSYSACTLRDPNKAWVAPFLAKGVTATMGSVTEPYLTGTPDVGVFAGRFIFEGFSFGEAAYASQLVLSWQTTVVGDPLYRPFAKNPDMLLEELQQRHSKYLDWAYLRLANINLANGRPMGEVVTLLEQLPLTKTSAILTEKLGDLYEAQGKPASAVHAYEQALKLEPSPQQRIRLLLTLGAKLVALDRDDEAYEIYQRFLRTVPDYPDPLAIYRKLLPLAQRLKKTQDAEKYEAEITKLTPPPPKS